MTGFICPVCGEALVRNGQSLACGNRHSFDISRKGTVNLLRTAKARHGDDKLMVSARKSFLDKGYYLPLLDTVYEMIHKVIKSGDTLLDCGCGECWYTANIEARLISDGVEADIFGIDVSKEAISAGASRSRSLRLAVASVYGIPLPKKSCDIVMSLFAPFSAAEYLRVLKDGGYFVTAFPLEEHLWELKQAVYDEPYKNTVADMDIDGFFLVNSVDVRGNITLLDNGEIMSLFSMTPYYYKTSPRDREKLMKLDSLTTRTEFRAAVYRKK